MFLKAVIDEMLDTGINEAYYDWTENSFRWILEQKIAIQKIQFQSSPPESPGLAQYIAPEFKL